MSAPARESSRHAIDRSHIPTAAAPTPAPARFQTRSIRPGSCAAVLSQDPQVPIPTPRLPSRHHHPRPVQRSSAQTGTAPSSPPPQPARSPPLHNPGASTGSSGTASLPRTAQAPACPGNPARPRPARSHHQTTPTPPMNLPSSAHASPPRDRQDPS